MGGVMLRLDARPTKAFPINRRSLFEGATSGTLRRFWGGSLDFHGLLVVCNLKQERSLEEKAVLGSGNMSCDPSKK